MSKKNKNAKANFEFDVRPVPFGIVSLDDFVSTKAFDAVLKSASEQENPYEKAFDFLCSYQYAEICNSFYLAGRTDLLDNEEFQKNAVESAYVIVSKHFIEMFMAVGGHISNLLAKNDVQEGGV